MTSLSRNMDIELQNFQGLLKFIEKSEARLVDNLVHFIDLGISTREIEVEMKEARKQRKWLKMLAWLFAWLVGMPMIY